MRFSAHQGEKNSNKEQYSGTQSEYLNPLNPIELTGSLSLCPGSIFEGTGWGREATGSSEQLWVLTSHQVVTRLTQEHPVRDRGMRGYPGTPSAVSGTCSYSLKSPSSDLLLL